MATREDRPFRTRNMQEFQWGGSPVEQEGLLCSDRQWVSVGRDGIASSHD